jgi:hypothetical protein
MLIELGINSRVVYEEDFEKHFLETSAQFYRVESGEFISSNSCSDYMKKVHVYFIFCEKGCFMLKMTELIILTG